MAVRRQAGRVIRIEVDERTKERINGLCCLLLFLDEDEVLSSLPHSQRSVLPCKHTHRKEGRMGIGEDSSERDVLISSRQSKRSEVGEE